MRITVRDNINEFLKGFKQYGPETVKAVVSALNKTAAQALTESGRMLTVKYALKQSDVKRVIRVIKANKNSLTSALYSSDKQMGYSPSSDRLKSAKWAARSLKRGTKITVKKGSPSMLKHAFVATMKSGHIGVYERTGGNRRVKRINSKGKVYYSQLPIREVTGPSVTFLFKSEGIMSKLKTFIDGKFPAVFKHEYEYYTKKLNK